MIPQRKMKITQAEKPRSEESKLSYRETPVSAAVISVLSLFCQWANWFVYEKVNYPWGFTFVTPLILCLMYHFVQLDSSAENNGSSESSGLTRRFVYLFAAIVPLLTGILITVVMLIFSPDISVFNPDKDYTGTFREVIAVYAGRFAVTSLYLTVFGIIDMPILKSADSRKK